jgi:hypothetical protein
MPTAKLLIDKGAKTLPEEPVKLAGLTVADHRDLSGKWSVADLGVNIGTAGDAWDIAYDAVRETPGHFFEPDYPSGFHITERPLAGLSGAGDGDFGTPNDQIGNVIRGPGFAWYRGDRYTQLARACIEADQESPSDVRVAICDVGFDLTHVTLPKKIDLVHARNFLADAASNNVRDRNVQGLLQNPGHGTATIALLAASELPLDIKTAEPVLPNDRYISAVPQADVIPLRIATSVVLLDTSTFVQAMEYLLKLHADGCPIDVISMSMGGVASAAWADVVNRAYMTGITLVTAAGNNVPLGLLRSPTSIVFPARFDRVLSVTGITAAFKPYATLDELAMRGNYGPPSKMRTAIAAFTPNAPWAEFNSPKIIDLDGQGTSSATPQVAGAAALYLRKHKRAMTGWKPWQVVEAVRQALLKTAFKNVPETDLHYYGAGVLQALDALRVAPEKPAQPEQEDSVFLPAFEVFFGNFPFGVSEGENQENARRMLWLEAVQLIHRDRNVEMAVADPDSGPMSHEEQKKVTEAILASPHASQTLKRVLDKDYKPSRRIIPRLKIHPVPPAIEPEPAAPVNRRLRAYAFDPSLSGSFNTFQFNQVTLEVPWENLDAGPTGEYVEVIDHDPASGCYYAPVDLDHKHLLATDGLAPSTSHPQFHQQMAYTIAMRTIRHFELALGRRVQWSPHIKEGSRDDSDFVQRLRIYPHALRERNAYYHPGKKALLLGYFPAQPVDPGELYSGGTTFTCLSHDIIAHETTHAILDGIYRNFNNPTNSDQLAFHEAFADIVALFQHFTIPSVVESQIRRTRGRLELDNALLEMAREFGKAAGMHGALRTAIGGGADLRTGEPIYNALTETSEIHARGAILVAAVFDAFLNVYRAKTADLARIATGGTGILPKGEIHPDLVKRFAMEASKLASQFLLMCIRALDYCPPVDLNFGDYLRALITADHDLVPNDPWGYRVAITESFRKRAIFPSHLGTLGEETLLWRPPESDLINKVEAMFRSTGRELDQLAEKLLHIDAGPGQQAMPSPPNPTNKRPGARSQSFAISRLTRKKIHDKLCDYIMRNPTQRADLAHGIGLDLSGDPPSFEVHTAWVAQRQGPDGGVIHQFVITLVKSHKKDDIELWSGATVLLNRSDRSVRYVIRKSALNEQRLQENVAFALNQIASENPYFRISRDQRFALIHSSGGNIL